MVMSYLRTQKTYYISAIISVQVYYIRGVAVITFQPCNVLVDWIIAETLCLKQSGHGGRIRYLMKKSILYIPLYGWYLNTVGCNTLD